MLSIQRVGRVWHLLLISSVTQTKNKHTNTHSIKQSWKTHQKAKSKIGSLIVQHHCSTAYSACKPWGPTQQIPMSRSTGEMLPQQFPGSTILASINSFHVICCAPNRTTGRCSSPSKKIPIALFRALSPRPKIASWFLKPWCRDKKYPEIYRR